VGYQVGGAGSWSASRPSHVPGRSRAAASWPNVVDNTNPMNVCFNTTSRTRSNASVLGGPGIGFTTASAARPENSWCASGICNFDSLVPSIPGAALALWAGPHVLVGGAYASTCPAGQRLTASPTARAVLLRIDRTAEAEAAVSRRSSVVRAPVARRTATYTPGGAGDGRSALVQPVVYGHDHASITRHQSVPPRQLFGPNQRHRNRLRLGGGGAVARFSAGLAW